MVKALRTRVFGYEIHGQEQDLGFIRSTQWTRTGPMMTQSSLATFGACGSNWCLQPQFSSAYNHRTDGELKLQNRA